MRLIGLGSLGLKFGLPTSSGLPGVYTLHSLLPDLNFSFHKCPHSQFSSLATHVLNITMDPISYIASFQLSLKEYVLGNSTQYSVMTYMGKESKKEWM